MPAGFKKRNKRFLNESVHEKGSIFWSVKTEFDEYESSREIRLKLVLNDCFDSTYSTYRIKNLKDLDDLIEALYSLQEDLQFLYENFGKRMEFRRKNFMPSEYGVSYYFVRYESGNMSVDSGLSFLGCSGDKTVDIDLECIQAKTKDRKGKVKVLIEEFSKIIDALESNRDYIKPRKFYY